MANLTPQDVIRLRTRIARAAPHLQAEINALADAALRGRRVQWVEVTYLDGCKETLPAEEYQALTAFDLAYKSLRVLTDEEAEQRNG